MRTGRRPGRRALLSLAAAALVGPVAAAGGLSAQQAVERLFYHVDTEAGYASLRENIEHVTIVAPSAYRVDEDGVVWGEVDPRVTRLAADHGVDVMPLILNPGFDQAMLHELLGDEEARRRAVRSMVELCRRHGFAGIQFDFENVHITDRDAYTRFYREAAEALHAAGYRISIAVVHRPDELPGPTRYHKWLFKNWRAGYDLAALAEIGDFVSVMTYAQHTRRMPPGPQAGIPWVEDVIEHFLEHMPPEKLSLGIPLGSQHWYTSQEDRIEPEMARSYSEQVTHERATALVERYGAELIWSDEHAVPYAFYERGGSFEWIFMEDARSFGAKLERLDRYGLRGFSAWVLGSEDPGIWDVLGGITTARR
ncbi:MAG: glycosyl hydrolase family 18 protein [Gemmatimonadota bacterium]